MDTYSSSTNDVATGCFLIVKGVFSLKLTSANPVSSFTVTAGKWTEITKAIIEKAELREGCFLVREE